MGIEFIDRTATLLRTAETVAAVLDPAATPAGDLLAEIEEVLGNRTVGEVVHDAMFNDLAMSARLLRNVLVIWVRTWDQGGRESLLNLICVPATDTEDPMLVAAVRTLMALAACSERGEGGSTEEEDREELDADGLARLGLKPPHMDVVELLDEMARLVQRDNPAGAAQILISALQLTRDPAAGEEFAERAGWLAAQANAPERPPGAPLLHGAFVAIAGPILCRRASAQSATSSTTPCRSPRSPRRHRADALRSHRARG